MPKITLFFPKDFDDPAWAGSSFCLEAPEDHGHHRSGEWVLGRHPASDVTISIRSVSKNHCAIAYSYASNRWAVTDLGSTNGTRLNGELLSPNDPRPLKIGDRLHIGPNLVQIVEDDQDTVGDDNNHEPTTIVGTRPLDHRTGEPLPPAPPPPKTYADTLDTGLSWLLHPTTTLGALVRLAVVAAAALVFVLVQSGAS